MASSADNKAMADGAEPAVTDAERKRVLAWRREMASDLRLCGWSMSQIAAVFGVSTQLVWRMTTGRNAFRKLRQRKNRGVTKCGRCGRLGHNSRSCLAVEAAVPPVLAKRPRRELIDLTGKRFGRLTVIARIGSSYPGKWLCQCDCGVSAQVIGRNLRGGKTKSCGCLKREAFRGPTSG